MAVQSIFFSDRDGLEKALENPGTMTFTSKKEADERDKMLEFSGEVAAFLQAKVSGLTDEQAEACGMALAEDRELLKRAIKDPSVLNQPEDQGQEG